MKIKPRDSALKLLPYPAGKPIEEVKREYGLAKVIKLASNENPLGPSPKAVEAIKNHAQEMNLYPDGSAHNLRKGLSGKYGIPMEKIICGNGSDELLLLIAAAFLDPEDEVIVSQFAFIRYQMHSVMMGAAVISVPMIGWHHDFDGFIKAITSKTKIIFFSNPNNPIGTMVGREAFEKLIRNVPDNILIVVDEAYYEYADDLDYPNSLEYLDSYDNILVLRTFSKAYGLAGLRIGYGIGETEVIHTLNRVRPPFNVTRIAQIAATAALEDSEHIQKTNEVTLSGLEYLYGEVEGMGLEYVPSKANFVLINVQKDCREVFDGLLRKGVIVRPMAGYGLKTHIRVTVGTQEENEKFIDALKSLL